MHWRILSGEQALHPQAQISIISSDLSEGLKKIFKENGGVAVKTREPVRVIVTSGVIPAA